MPKQLPSKNSNSSLPIDKIRNANMGNLLDRPDTDVIKKGNKVSVRQRSENSINTFQYTSYESGRNEIKATSVPHRERKKDYRDDILAMKREGMSQEDIAFELGMSQSTVSRILRESHE